MKLLKENMKIILMTLWKGTFLTLNAKSTSHAGKYQ